MSPRLPTAVEGSAGEIAAKADSARHAAAVWRRRTVEERVKVLRDLWKALSARRLEIRAVVHEETGKPLVEVDLMELGAAGLLVDWMTAAAPRILGDKAASKPWSLFNKRAYERRVPRGVIGLITPWNMPFLIPFGDAFAAMLAGNAVLLKPSEWTTKTALWLETAVTATSLLPTGLLSVVPGGAAAGEAVIDASDMTVFTGSTKTGRAVAVRAAGQLKPVILELGGKHPMIVLADASLERAAAAAVWAGFSNAGQVCVGGERVFVEGATDADFCSGTRVLYDVLPRAEPGMRVVVVVLVVMDVVLRAWICAGTAPIFVSSSVSRTSSAVVQRQRGKPSAARVVGRARKRCAISFMEPTLSPVASSRQCGA
ncbi:MAG: aldehyde dehydrogenase family protein, partial [Elusimicrobiota bacterium]